MVKISKAYDESMELPAKCEKCKKFFDLKDEICEKDTDRLVADVIKEMFPKGLLCPKCRK